MRTPTSTSITEAKSQADRLTARLGELGVKLKRTQALEAIAAIYNFSDWNRFQASASEGDLPAELPAEPKEAIISNYGRHKVIALGMGEGKGTMLKLLLMNAVEKNAVENNGETALYLSIGGSGFTFNSIPRKWRSLMTCINVTPDSEGNISLPPMPTSKGIFLNIENVPLTNPPYDAKFRRENLKAFANFTTQLKANWGDKIKANISLVLIDEVHRIYKGDSAEEADVFGRAMQDLDAKNRQIVISTQWIGNLFSASLSPSDQFALIASTNCVESPTAAGIFAYTHFLDIQKNNESLFTNIENYIEDVAAFVYKRIHRTWVEENTQLARHLKKMLSEIIATEEVVTFVRLLYDAGVKIDGLDAFISALESSQSWRENLNFFYKERERHRFSFIGDNFNVPRMIEAAQIMHIPSAIYADFADMVFEACRPRNPDITEDEIRQLYAPISRYRINYVDKQYEVHFKK